MPRPTCCSASATRRCARRSSWWRRRPIQRGHKIPEVEQLVSAAAAAENIMLAARAQGFGAMWKTGAPAYDATVKQALGLDPDNDIVGFLYVGTQVGGGSPAARPVVQDLVSVWQG